MKRYIVHFLMMILVLPVFAQIRGNSINVTVTPDHKDWNYRIGEKAVFTVNVLKSGTLLDNVRVDFEAGPEMYPEVDQKDVLLKDGTMKWTGTMKRPGFYRLKVTAHVGDRRYEGLCTAGFSTENIRPVAEAPDDFDSFWENALREARYTSLEPTKELLPERCTKDVNVYKVSFQNIRWGSRTYGILCVPSKPGRYPALLRVPGAGIRPYQGDSWFASKGCITLEIGIHGIPVTMTQDFYDKLAAGALNGYWNFNAGNRDENYYKRVFIGAVRAIDYIAELPEWDGTNLGVTGSSQGGMLSLVCAALDKRVTCYGAVHAAMCDHTASLKGVACGWPHYFYMKKDADKNAVYASGYYDGINFARRITCPGWFSFGYNDDVVPPTTAFATYNTVTAPKMLSTYQQTGHYWYQEQWDEWNEWLAGQLGLASKDKECSSCGKSVSQQLMSRLEMLQKKGYMFGHQDDPMYGLSWEWDCGNSDVKAVCGDYPAVMGFDLGGIEMGDDKNLDSVPFTRIREEIIAHHGRGGIITISWHPRNLLTGGTAWDVSDNTVVRNILTDGSKTNAIFKEWLSRVSVFLKSLKDAGGKPVPVIFRPWHENTGSWFWWGEKLCTEDEFKGLWNMTQDYMRNEGFCNLVWSYSPGMAPDLTEEKFMERYPGNSRVDMVGIDGYQWGTEKDFVSQLDANLAMITKFSKENGKIPALTECGLKNLTDPTWFSRVLKPVADKYPISYFLVWRNYKEEYFGPAPGHPCESDFMKLYNAPNTLFLKDIQGVK